MWLSILKTATSPSPMSTTPAFSPGPWMTTVAGGRQRAQPFLRALVGAVLVPHGREDAELGQRRLAADQVEDALVFVRLQPVVGDEFRGDGDLVRNVHCSPLCALGAPFHSVGRGGETVTTGGIAAPSAAIHTSAVRVVAGD